MKQVVGVHFLLLLVLLFLGQIDLFLLHLVKVEQSTEVCLFSGLCLGRLEVAEAVLLIERILLIHVHASKHAGWLLVCQTCCWLCHSTERGSSLRVHTTEEVLLWGLNKSSLLGLRRAECVHARKHTRLRLRSRLQELCTKRRLCWELRRLVELRCWLHKHRLLGLLCWCIPDRLGWLLIHECEGVGWLLSLSLVERLRLRSPHLHEWRLSRLWLRLRCSHLHEWCRVWLWLSLRLRLHKAECSLSRVECLCLWL
jgi:hypothetical protein